MPTPFPVGLSDTREAIIPSHLWAEKEGPKQSAGVPIYAQALQRGTAKPMTSLHSAYVTFLGNFFNQVYFPFDSDF